MPLTPEQLVANSGGPSVVPQLPNTAGKDRVANSKIYKGTFNQAKAFQDILPSLMSTFFGSLQGNAPLQAQQQLDIFKNLGPQYASAEAAVNKIGQEEKVNTDLGLLQGKGRDLTLATNELARLADPEFFALREKLGSKAGALLDSQDPTQLTGSELANVERGVNRSNIQSGLAGSGSVIGTVKNAMTFGNELANKQSRLGATLNSIGSLAPNLRAGTFNPQAATGSAGAGSGAAQFASATDSANQLGGNFASNVLGQAGGAGAARGSTQAGPKSYERILGAMPDY